MPQRALTPSACELLPCFRPQALRYRPMDLDDEEMRDEIHVQN